MTKYAHFIRKVADGEPVNAATANRSAEDLDARTSNLKETLEAYQAGQALTDQDAPLTSDTFIGAVVYWSAADDAYAPALATYAVSEGGVVVPNVTARALGIVLAKTSTTVGTVCFIGRIQNINITAAIMGVPAAGVYFLSSTEAGKITATQPPLAIPVVELDTVTNFWVNSTAIHNAHEHQHYSFELVPWPAGITDEPAEGVGYTFTETWSTELGWMPANLTNFPDGFPAGAAYGYNIEADEELADVWPPVPVENARLYVEGAIARPAQVVIDDDGIWWMTDCPDSVPWLSGSSEACGSSSIGCPPDWCDIHLELAFTHILGITADAFVTSIEGVAPIEIVSCASLAAAVRGRLRAQMTDYTIISFASGGVMPASALVDLTRTQRTNGPLVSGVRGTGRVTVVGSGAPVTGPSSQIFQTGGLTITVANADDAREGGTDIVALDNVGEATYNGNMYYRMIDGMDASIRGRVRVPLNFLPTNPRLTLSFWIMGVGVGVLPALTLDYSKMPYSTTALQTMPIADTILMTDIWDAVQWGGTAPTIAGAHQYVVVDSDAFAVTAGDIVTFELGRSSGDAYGADVGILGMRWQIDSA